MDNNKSRAENLSLWVCEQIQTEVELKLLAGDASFRKYYRFYVNNDSFIAMDAPPDKENNEAFVAIAKAFAKKNILVPKIFAQNLKAGFLILSDLGDNSYLNMYQPNNQESLIDNAIETLLKIQKCYPIPNWQLSPFDKNFILKEISLFTDWFLAQYLSIKISTKQENRLQIIIDNLIESILQQPKVTIHRDFHSRNLMLCESNEMGVLDFQDAVIGPVTYDLVSLLKDCYWRFDRKFLETKINKFKNLAIENNTINNDFAFEHAFDLMGMQRHMKALGIFARLELRDKRQGYAKDMPRTINYLLEIAREYTEYKELLEICMQAEEKLLAKEGTLTCEQ